MYLSILRKHIYIYIVKSSICQQYSRRHHYNMKTYFLSCLLVITPNGIRASLYAIEEPPHNAIATRTHLYTLVRRKHTSYSSAEWRKVLIAPGKLNIIFIQSYPSYRMAVVYSLT